MTSLKHITSITLAVTVLAAVSAAGWIIASAGGAAGSTYAALGALMIAVGVVGFSSYRNGLAPRTMSQVLHDTEIAPSTSQAVSRTRVTTRVGS